MSIKSILLTGAIAAVTVTTAAAPAFAASSDSTKAQVEAMRKVMQAQIDELKQQVQQLSGQQQATQAQTQVTQQKVDTAVAAVQQVTPPKGKKGIQIGSVTLTPGGFIEAAGIYRTKNMTSDVDTNFNNTPYKNSSNAYVDENRFSARQSRLSLLATSDINDTTHAGAYYEMDFLGAANTANSRQSNSYNIRQRHIYGTVDWDDTGWHLLAGQTWSMTVPFGSGMNPRSEVTPVGIDAHYIVGFDWTRNPQFRVTKDFLNKTLWLGVSVENAQETATALNAPTAANFLFTNTSGGLFDSTTTYTIDAAPDVIAKVAYEPGWGHYELYGLLSNFRDRAAGTNNNSTGGGIGGSAQLPVIPKLLDVTISGLDGSGVGRYGTAQLPDLTYDNLGKLHPLSGYSVMVGVIGHPTPVLDIYGYGGQEHVNSWSTVVAGKGYGYGSPLTNNAGCTIEGGTCQAVTKDITEGSVGFWWKFANTGFGSVRWGAQAEYITKQAYAGVGGAPKADNEIIMTSLRWYPF
jgi:hypothetical protein